jgi:mannose-6-phosphate isomerase-like protein (cupin superfamily)
MVGHQCTLTSFGKCLMGIRAAEAIDSRLLKATLEYIASHRDEKMDLFRENLINWGTEWAGVTSAHLAASDILATAYASAEPATPEYELMRAFVEERASRHWEQSYSKTDAAVGADMLANYGYAEIIGKQGPFVSACIRAGVGVFGPDIDYPPHCHQAEEVYVILVGSAEFRVGGGARAERRKARDTVQIPSMQHHGFRTTLEPVVILYLWQGGDLREKSTFV